MPLTGALKDWVAKLKAYQAKHGVSYRAAMSALKGSSSKGRRKSHRGGGVADAAEAFTPQGDAATAPAHPPQHSSSPSIPPAGPAGGPAGHSSAQSHTEGLEVKALPQSGGSGLGMFEVGAAAQQGGRRRRRSSGSSKRGRFSKKSKKSHRRKQHRQRSRSRSRRGGSGAPLAYSDYA